MSVHVKMLDKDGVGFRFVTVEDPVCIQLIPTDPDIGGYPVLRIGRPPAPIINYPLTNDAYVMNDAGETISKVSLKECLREIDKEQFRPDRKGLAELQPFEEQHRKVVGDSLRMSSLHIDMKSNDPIGLVEDVQQAFNGTDKNPNGNRPRAIHLDPKFRRIELSEVMWWVYNGDKLIDVLMLGAKDLATLNAYVAPNDRDEFNEYVTTNWSGKPADLEAFNKEIARNNKLYDAYMLVVGTTIYTSASFTPLMPDPELGNNLYTLISGQKIHISDLTMGDVLINNVFYLNPLSVNSDEVECDPEIMKYMLEASTVYFHACPEERTDETGIRGWIDYQIWDGNKKDPKSAVKDDNEIYNKAVQSLSTSAYGEFINAIVNTVKGNPPGAVKACVISQNVGLAVAEFVYEIAIAVSDHVVMTAKGNKFVKTEAGTHDHLIAVPTGGRGIRTWFDLSIGNTSGSLVVEKVKSN